MKRARAILREPLLHFLMLGAGLYALFAALEPPAEEGEVVVLSDSFVEGLRLEHQQRTGSAPDDEEAMIARFLRDEALYRKALELGLDGNDPIVRRRLIQKMEFLLRSAAEIDPPSDTQLQHYLRTHRERFEAADRVSFTHVFFSSERRETPEQDARVVLGELGGDSEVQRAEDRGDPYMHGYVMRARSVPEVARTFGDEVAAALRQAPLDGWSGPVQGSYGWHLLRVTEREAGGLPPLADVHGRVARAWSEEARDEALVRATDALVEALRVQHEESP